MSIDRRLRGDGQESVAARVVLACIVVGSVGVALAWMLALPLFQAPDENAHFDYAYQLYLVGRPYRVEHATCNAPTEVTQATRYLERRSDFYGVRLLSGARVPRGYGGAAYVRSVDELAPAEPRKLPASGSAAPCVMFTYPAGFYVAAAAVIGVASAVTNGSLVAEFFSVRALGIVCLSMTLLLAYRLFRASRVATPAALLATAAIGIFPLTSWVSASVQPDNVTFTSVTLGLFIAMRIRNRPLNYRAVALLVFVISLLAFVKQHYAAVLYIACASCVSAAYLRSTWRTRANAIALTLLWLVPLVALRFATFATPVGSLHTNFVPTAAVPKAASPEDTLALITAFAVKNSYGAFVSGLSFHRFWNAFGWTHVPFFSDLRFDSAVELVIGIASATVALLFMARQASVVRRLLQIAYLRSPACALRLTCSDVVVNTYVLWTGLLIVVSAVARGTWSLQGRYWLPVMVPLMIILMRNVPHVLPQRMRDGAATLGASAMLCYSAICTPFALAAVQQRYYQSSGAVSRVTVVAVDGSVLPQQLAARSIGVPRGEAVIINGVAFHSTDGSPINHVSLRVDDGRPLPARYGIPVATGIAPLAAGFKATIPTILLATGIHRVSILAYVDERHFDDWQNAIVLEVRKHCSGRKPSVAAKSEVRSTSEPARVMVGGAIVHVPRR